MKKKLIALVLTILAAIMLLTGCNPVVTNPAGQPDNTSPAAAGEAGAKPETAKKVDLKMYLLGDGAADVELVYGEINKILEQTINATIKVDFLSWAEHDTKYPLLFSSGEDFDLIFTAAGWGHYEQTATKKGFYELTPDFLSAYAPDIMKVVPDAAWSQAKINGKFYMVPNYSNEYGYDVIGVRGDLMDKYGISAIESKADLEAYYDKIIANEKDISPLATQGIGLQYPYMFQSRGWQVLRGTPLPLILYETANPSNTKVVSTVESPEFREYAHKMKEMADKGYWSRDSLSASDTRNDLWVLGKAASMVWNVNNVSNYAQQINKEHPEWKATFVDIAPTVKRPVNPYTNNGVAINAISKNPERAMMALNQFMTNKAVYDLAAYGVEGVHFKAVGDDKYTPIDENAGRFPAMTVCNWGWNNENLKRSIYVENPDPVIIKAEECIDKWSKDLTSFHPLDAFSFTEENVKNEVAVITTLVTQYLDPISVGIVADVDKAVDELIAKMKEAGIDKVVQEAQRQVDEYLAGQ